MRDVEDESGSPELACLSILLAQASMSEGMQEAPSEDDVAVMKKSIAMLDDGALDAVERGFRKMITGHEVIVALAIEEARRRREEPEVH